MTLADKIDVLAGESTGAEMLRQLARIEVARGYAVDLREHFAARVKELEALAAEIHAQATRAGIAIDSFGIGRGPH